MLAWVGLGLVLLFGFVVAFGAPYVPSHRREVRRSFKELYELKPDDVVVDLGSGDGVVLAEAARRGAAVYGVELNPLLVLFARLRLARTARTRVSLGDMWRYRLPDDTTLVYAFSVTRDRAKLVRRLQHEADRLGTPFYLMVYGSTLASIEPIRAVRGHTLYEFSPLQGREA